MANHIKNIHIKHFKCFDDFEVKDLARVNLITGKNNVGKTAFLEACYINSSAQELKYLCGSLYGIKYRRENLNILFANEQPDVIKYMAHSSGFDVSSNINYSSFNINNKNGIKTYNFRFADEKISVNSNQFSIDIVEVKNIEFIDNFGFSNIEFIKHFATIQKLDKESFLNKILSKFDSNITSFKIIDDKPQCKVKDKYREISELGEGTQHLIAIITSLFTCKDGYLFIDEIGSGIHYEKLDDLWKIILTVSKEQNVQVFAVTHSKECLESYVRVVKQLDNKDVALVQLGKSDGELKNIVFTANEMINEVSQDLEVRGWDG